MTSYQHLVLYDGECGLCHGAVRFILKRDREHRFAFAALQSELGIKELNKHNMDPTKLDSIVLIENHQQPKESSRIKSKAAFRIGIILGGLVGMISRIGALLPRIISDLGYDFVAKIRKKIFGTKDSCELPSPNERSRFLG